jgi:uridine kinase
MDEGTRGELLGRLAGAIESVTTAHPLRVAVDGPPAAGKTTLADELTPLGPGGDRRYQPAVYDLHTDTAVSPPVTTAPAGAVLLLDGVFLLRPELAGRWDLTIFVSAAFERILDRARIRDLALLGSAAEVERRFRTRYLPAQQLYYAAARPADHADIIVRNDEPRRPAWEVRPH